MKIRIFLLGILCGFFIACENDDLCADTVVTPNFVVRIHDKNIKRQTKIAQNLLAYGQGNPLPLLFASTDSLALPLKMLENESHFVLVKDATIDANGNLTAGETTTLSISYTPQQQFLSKGCGFRVVFKNLSVQTSPNSWISSVKLLNTQLENDKKAILHIYY